MLKVTDLLPIGEHTHFWREGGAGREVDPGAGQKVDPEAGGHYHGDTSPDQVSYTGYFTLAETIVRLWDAVEQKLTDKQGDRANC